MPGPRLRTRRFRILSERTPWGGLTAVDIPRTLSEETFATVTADATIHTKGAWAQLIAATSAAATMMRVVVRGTFTAATATDMLLDIGTGANPSETAIISNIQAGWSGSYAIGVTPHEWWFPVSIPAGTRISARLQALISADTAEVAIELYSGGVGAAVCETMGANLTTSRGVDVVAGTSNAEGLWTEIVASTTSAYSGLLWSVGGAGDTTLLTGNALLDIGTGAAASETAIVTNWPFIVTSSEYIVYARPIMPMLAHAIPAGTRLSARIQFQGAAQSHDIILFGIR